MNKVLFSIIIPTYNRANLIKRCLDSVLNQTYSNWEAIVVDNYSEDDTEKIVESLNDSRLQFVKIHNYGVIAVSRNKGIDLAEGDWICFLDSDDVWYPNKLEMMLPYLDNYDLIYHGFRKNIPRTKILQKMNCYFFPIKESSASWLIQRGDPISPSCSCVSRKAIGDTRFDEDKSLVAVEDFDFFLQIVDKGIKIKYLRKVLTLYDMNGCSHDEAAVERDLLLYKKWESRIDDRARKELKYQSIQRKADSMRYIGNFDDAHKFYYDVLKSSLYSTKLAAIKGIILCSFKISFSDK